MPGERRSRYPESSPLTSRAASPTHRLDGPSGLRFLPSQGRFPRNPLELLLTSLSLTAGGRLRFAETETATPLETGRFARSPSTLSPKTETSHQPARVTQTGEITRKTLRPVPPSPSNPSPGVAATILQCGAPIRTDFATASALRRKTSRIPAVERNLFSWLGSGHPPLWGRSR